MRESICSLTESGMLIRNPDPLTYETYDPKTGRWVESYIACGEFLTSWCLKEKDANEIRKRQRRMRRIYTAIDIEDYRVKSGSLIIVDKDARVKYGKYNEP